MPSRVYTLVCRLYGTGWFVFISATLGNHMLALFSVCHSSALFANMLCDCCYLMLRGQKGLQWRGSYDLHFHHHESEQALRESAKTCFVCQTIMQKLPERGWLDWLPRVPSFVRLFYGANQQEGRFRASLSRLPDNERDYLLEFFHQDLAIGAFALQHSGLCFLHIQNQRQTLADVRATRWSLTTVFDADFQ